MIETTRNASVISAVTVSDIRRRALAAVGETVVSMAAYGSVSAFDVQLRNKRS
jgi:hypothetical protein